MESEGIPPKPVVAVTGISGSIGQAIARALEARGYQVAGLGRNQSEDRLDLFQPPEAVALAVLQAAERWGPFDAWCNVAGADILSEPHRELPFEEKMDLLWQVDVRGTIAATRAALPHLKPGGVVINFGWDRSAADSRGESAQLYALAKAAITAYSQSLAKACKDYRIYVIAPGMVASRWGMSLSPQRQQKWLRKNNQSRWIWPAEVAEVAAELVVNPIFAPSGRVLTVGVKRSLSPLTDS